MNKLLNIFSGDKVFLTIVIILSLGGVAIFSSATLGALARADTNIIRSAIVQIIFGLGGGIAAFILFRVTPLKLFKKLSPWFFIASLLLTISVFIPGLGSHVYGATRWLDLRFITVQPAEFLKIGVVFFVAWYLSKNIKRLSNYKYGLVPFMIIVGVPALILLLQPNTSTVLLIGVTSTVMYFAAGAPYRDFAILILTAAIALGIVLLVRPYALQRFTTFLNPASDPQGSGYQIKQSLIAIGSGEITGRGFGESVQKFNYLPEPDGDSVFAVFAEEVGFIGSVLLVGLFLFFAARGITIARDAPSYFSGLVALGFAWLITFQAFVNMNAMLGLIPLTGLPLPFISHGGTALLVVLAESGFILNVAAHRKGL